MYSTVHLIVAALRAPSSISRSVWRCGFLLSQFAFALASLALSGSVEAAALSRFNTADGDQALNVAQYSSNGTGSYNTGLGYAALLADYTGNYNTASGANALYRNSSGNFNTADGAFALYNNTANYNTACGASALQNNTTGTDNTASGLQALFTNSTGYDNTANGFNALYSNTSGHDNAAVGFQALNNNTTGNNNLALGMNAGFNLTTGNNNIVIGAGVLGTAGDANKIRIGKATHSATYIAGIYNKMVASGTGVAVRIDSTGKLGTVLSSARFKEAIKPMDQASDAILKLEPVTFRYKPELDPDGVLQFGLIAEQVERVNSDLVVRDEDGKVSTVRYEAVNAMLLNEFLKEHRKVQELEMKAGQQQKHFESALAKQEMTIEKQQKEIDALIAGLQKVTARVEAANPVPRVVSDN
jgi:uncharacterized coiled-coil protein SlyX